MRVSNLNNNVYNLNYYNKPQNKTFKNSNPPLLNKNLSCKNAGNVSFEGNFNKNYIFEFLHIDPIHTFKNFTKDEYLKLSEVQKQNLRNKFKIFEARDPGTLRGIGELHAYAAECIKDALDNRFGKNKYVVVPIGRSISSIGRALSLKIGEENVIPVPMSNAGRFFTNPLSLTEYRDFINSVKTDKGLNVFKKYLESCHLSKNDIETSGKNYVLIDYCYRGYSLKGAEQFFKSDLIWGNKKNNIFAVDFLKLLGRYDEEVIRNKMDFLSPKQNILNNIHTSLLLSAFKDYSTVGAAKSLDQTIDAANEKRNSFLLPSKIKLVWFKLIDTIMTGKGDFPVKLRSELPEDSIFCFNINNQVVEPWHDVQSQYLSDLTNVLNSINKILIKCDNTEGLDNDQLIKDIKGVYAYLSYCYQVNKDLSIQNMFNFYQIQTDINELIGKVNSKYNF